MPIQTNRLSAFDCHLPATSSVEKREENLTWVWGLAAIGDILITFLAMAAAFFFRFNLQTGPAQYLSLWAYMSQLIFGVLILFAVQFSRGLYRRSSLLSRHDTIFRSFMSSVIWLPVFLGGSVIFNIQPEISRLYAILSGLLLCVTLPVWRLSLNFVMTRDCIFETLRENALVIGWNKRIDRFYTHSISNPNSAYRITACVPHQNGDYGSEPPLDLNRLPSFDSMESALRSGRFDTVIVSDLDMSPKDLLSLNRLCGRELVNLIVLPNMVNVFLSRLSIRTVGSVPLMGTEPLPLDNPGHLIVKRIMDVVGGIFGLLLSAPIIAFFCLLVYRESPGPVFYRQLRVGKNGKLFDIIKIRSMRLHADKEKSGFSTKNDNRRLQIGELIRGLNIDEMPQFWNVIKGEMSLVGPRPERPELIKNFKDEIEYYNLRHAVKPGISGWAQINGWRGDTDLEPRIQHDLEYMERWSVWFDLYILLKTPFSSYQNAY